MNLVLSHQLLAFHCFPTLDIGLSLSYLPLTVFRLLTLPARPL